MNLGEMWFLLILVELLTIIQWVEVRGDFCWYWCNQYQQKSPRTSIHWVMVNNSTNINKNHLSPQFIEWWSTIPTISTTIISHFNSLSDGQRWIEGWFLLILVVELLTITQWVEVRGDVCWYWWNCWPSLNEFRRNVIFVDIIEWWSTITSISTKITSHLNTLIDGQQFHQYQQKSPLTSTHWVMSIITPTSTKITQWDEVRGDFC
jgi:hypothetical protein